MSFVTVFFEANTCAIENEQKNICIYAQKLLNKGLYLLYAFMSLLYLIISVRKMVNFMVSHFKCSSDSQKETHVLFHCVALQLPEKGCKTEIYSEYC